MSPLFRQLEQRLQETSDSRSKKLIELSSRYRKPIEEAANRLIFVDPNNH
jgi:hypothetical protein